MADDVPDGSQFSGFRGIGEGDPTLARAHRGAPAGPGRASNGRARVPGQAGAEVVADGEADNGGETAAMTPNPLPELDLSRLSDRARDLAGRPAGQAPDIADHPLLRGLLRELPPRGTPLPPGWLERWFAATRSVLELIYAEPPRGS
ncbi:hypothetical protein GCM10010124_29530 [Pilimelia terevasa]|uniref:Uncharacterized protein n=2 Tax=Pilimelia terevasa TaxID=53372 RepID=A0A8J3BNX7_9ACTN|nr:hypothetical protein GCM10010124_29530 [Pilimelia terevasa]